VQNEAVFVQYLDVGLWHLAFYKDGKDKETVSFNTVVLGRYKLWRDALEGGMDARSCPGFSVEQSSCYSWGQTRVPHLDFTVSPCQASSDY
jgi:hypothetical protein